MKQERCSCPGPCCGDQSYGEMLKAMEDHFVARDLSYDQLRSIHLKWKRVAAEVR